VQREQALLAEFGERWKEEETDLEPRTLVFHRGFPAICMASLSHLRRKIGLRTIVPLDELRLNCRTDDWTKLNPRFEFPPVSRLMVDACGSGNELSVADAERFASFPWPRLRFLHLRAHQMSAGLLRGLSQGPFRNLEGATLPGEFLDDAGDFFDSTEFFGSIAWLKIEFPHRTTDLFGPQPLPPLEGLRILLSARPLSRLRHLVSMEGEIGAGAANIIAANAERWDLRSLSLPGNELGNAGVFELFGGQGLSRLERLNLTQNEISDDGFAALASSPHMKSLTHIELARNRMTDAGAIALASSTTLNSVRQLRVGANNITDRGKQALTERFGNAVGY
jgi:hypothetical protein